MGNASPTQNSALSPTTYLKFPDVMRWRIEDACVPLEFPSWDWKSHTNGVAYYKLPRILAHAMSSQMALLPFDGNLGLAVPGQVHFYLLCSPWLLMLSLYSSWRGPWDAHRNHGETSGDTQLTTVAPEDRVVRSKRPTFAT